MFEKTTDGRNSQITKTFTFWVLPKCGDTAAQEAAEAYLENRVKTARQKYQLSESRLRQIISGQTKWPVSEPDGSAMLHAARLEEIAARNEYVRLLKAFSELLVQGEAAT